MLNVKKHELDSQPDLLKTLKIKMKMITYKILKTWCRD